MPRQVEGHQARRRFGQNFLQDGRIIERIVQAIAPRAGQRLVEIGPGLGALTGPLLEAAGRLEVIELDRDLVPRLQQKFSGKGELIVHQGDALEVDLTAMAQGQRVLRIVGNLPYNISTPLIFHFCRHLNVIQDMYFMLQKEVVDRMTAVPGSKKWGRLSVMVQYDTVPEKLIDVPPQAFHPSPKVNSAVVRLLPKQEPRPVSREQLETVVATAFNQRRKTLRNALGNLFTVEELEAAQVDPGTRPEQLGLDDYVRLALALSRR
jgi:16S rRNA (adenine1518-N6/adenine1519-N6)-dimethyltransferase